MARANIDMINIRQILRLHSEGTSIREIKRLLGVSRKTITKYIVLFEESRTSYSEIAKMDDEALYELFLAKEKPTGERLEKLQSLLPDYEKRLRRKGVNKFYLWEQYKREYPGGYNYTQFCFHLNKYLKKNKATMHIEHKAGDKMFVDFTGHKMKLTDKQTGEIEELEVFVAILGSSGITYVEAVKSQRKRDFISAVENAMHYFGGTPLAIVPDNLKSAVKKSDKYEPAIDEDFRRFALHYGVAPLPTRSYKPKDKALVENAVRIIYTRIFAPLSDRLFFDIASVNEAIEELLDKHNKKNFQGKEFSRYDLFKEIEEQELKPLPPHRYIVKDYARLTVTPNCHIYLKEDKNYYSVPYRYIGCKVKVIYSQRSVEIYHDYKRIAIHKRSYRHYHYTTVKEHLASQHRFYTSWNPQFFINWASAIGNETRIFIGKLLESKRHPEQGYKSCLGVLNLAKKYNKERLNNACKRAIHFNSYSYTTIKNIINKGLDKLDLETKEKQYELPLHNNVRGGNYYQ